MDRLHLVVPPAVSELYAQEVAGSFRATCVLIGIWCGLSTLEWVSNIGLFQADGLLSWRILSLRPGAMFRSGRLQSWFWDRSICYVLGLRMLAAVGIIVAPHSGVAGGALLIVVSTSWFLTTRTWVGGDGADEIGQIASIGALAIAAGLALGQPGLAFAGTLFIGGQLTIAYFFAGLSKLLSSEWRCGRALVGIMGTHTYGHALGARVLGDSARFSIWACWVVIVAETLFPLLLLAPPALLAVGLAAFLMFHASHAYLMGLNTFAWAFAAAYPSFVVLHDLTVRALGWS